MEFHSPQSSHQSIPLDGQKFNARPPLSPRDQAFLDFAKKEYATHMGKAQQVDDSQEVFSSRMVNFLKASSLISQAALLTVAASKK